MGVYRYDYRVEGIGPGSPGLISFHRSVPSDADLEVQAARLDPWNLLNVVKGYMKTTVTIIPPSEAIKVDSDPEEFVTITKEPDIVGFDGGEPLPWVTQLCVSWRTALRGRSFMGRNFFPGITEAHSDNGTPTTAMLNAVTTACVDYATNLPAASNFPVVWSRKLGIATPITGARVRDQWAVLRSRRD